MTLEKTMSQQINGEPAGVRADRLLNKWAVEDRTSLDITTIYRKIKVGAFPRPVRVGKRRVAWRESDVSAWQASLEAATR